jgi:hypothetical protein
MLRNLPPFEFENWAVQQLNGRGNKVQVGDKTIHRTQIWRWPI